MTPNPKRPHTLNPKQSMLHQRTPAVFYSLRLLQKKVKRSARLTSEASAAGTSGDVPSGRPTQHASEMPADERSPDEGLRHSEDQINASLTHGVTPLSDEASGGPDAETLHSLGGGPQSPRGALQEGEVIVSEEAVVAAGEEDDVRSEETRSSTVSLCLSSGIKLRSVGLISRRLR
ncbi:hypothetical protein KUCAC02_013276 [Chaenocephalus aceratus]|nr:hypothetical protein KUCAC02_013276 [Chaenocephalus aceratus]